MAAVKPRLVTFSSPPPATATTLPAITTTPPSASAAIPAAISTSIFPPSSTTIITANGVSYDISNAVKNDFENFVNSVKSALQQNNSPIKGNDIDNVVNCPITPFEVVATVGGFLLATPNLIGVAGDVIEYAVTDVYDIAAFVLMLTFFLVILVFVVILGATKVISWTSAVILVVTGFVVLYYLSLLYREVQRLYLKNTVATLKTALAAEWNAKISGAVTAAAVGYTIASGSAKIRCGT